MKKHDNIKVVKEFNSWVNQVDEKYKFYSTKINDMDKLTQDILHKLELEELKYSDRAKLATELTMARKERRYYKDLAQQIFPVYEFLQDKNNHRIIMQFSQILGKMKEIVNVQQVRAYKYKYMVEEK